MLTRLTINSAQSCNLGCRYCYALGGEFGGPSIRIAPEVAVSRLREAAHAHSVIKLVQFIGGEPLLNLPALTAVSDEVDVLVRAGTLSRRPSLSAVTNLTILSDDHIDLFEKHGFVLLVSIDGPQEIHDELRPTKGGRGSHSDVMSNIEVLREEKIPFDISCVYTYRHLQSGISIVDLLKYFTAIGAGTIEIAPVSTAPKDPLGFNQHGDWRAVVDMQIDAINFCIDEFEKGNIIEYGLLGTLVAQVKVKAADRFCPAGESNLSVGSDGALNLCNMRTHDPAYATSITAQGKVLTKAHIAQCQVCEAYQWCYSCLGEMEIRSPGNPQPYPEHCETLRRGIRVIEQRLPTASRRRILLKHGGLVLSQLQRKK